MNTINECYNLIILDKSGSMQSIRQAAIAGVIETMGTIRAAEKKTGIKQYITLAAFCGCGITYILENAPVEKAESINPRLYEPCCMTPLYDAIGNCCTKLKKQLAGRNDATVSVTIITDGYENASTEFSATAVKSLIEMLKADGWLIAYIGANQDVQQVKFELNIDNVMDFSADEDGVKDMFRKERKARLRYMNEMASPSCCDLSSSRKKYFDNLDNLEDEK